MAWCGGWDGAGAGISRTGTPKCWDWWVRAGLMGLDLGLPGLKVGLGLVERGLQHHPALAPDPNSPLS